MTDREITEVCLSIIRSERKRCRVPDHYVAWLNQRERDLENKLKS